jgi:hypothetical protein
LELTTQIHPRHPTVLTQGIRQQMAKDIRPLLVQFLHKPTKFQTLKNAPSPFLKHQKEVITISAAPTEALTLALARIQVSGKTILPFNPCHSDFRHLSLGNMPRGIQGTMAGRGTKAHQHLYQILAPGTQNLSIIGFPPSRLSQHRI